MQVASEDSSYMPARILVLGGDDPSNINAELNTVSTFITRARHIVGTLLLRLSCVALVVSCR